MNKRALSETDICDRFITPALLQAGWLREQILREHAFTAGRIMVRGRLVARGRPRRADYVLLVGQVALAVIDANSKGWREMENARYAELNARLDAICSSFDTSSPPPPPTPALSPT